MWDFLYRFEKIVGGALLAVLSLTILTQVVFRFLFNFPLAWSEELSRYSFIWMTMAVAPICIREGANISMEMLVGRLPPAMARVCRLVGFTLVFVFLAVLAVWGSKIVGIVGAQRSPALGVSMAWVYGAIPVGAGLMLIELINAFRKQARGPRPPPGTTADNAQ